MKYLTPSIDIDILPLSTRSYNGLRKANINTIGDLLKFDSNNSFANIPHLGSKSISELNSIMDNLLHKDTEYCLVTEEE